MAVDRRAIERIGESLREARELAQASASEPESAGSSSRPAPVGSILAQAASLYGAKPNEEQTPPTGFDPAAALLFEALIEGAFLVANADGDFDADERAAFEQVVLAASNSKVSAPQLVALVAELDSALARDGVDGRVSALTVAVRKREQQTEVLRVAALIAHVSGGVSEVELALMQKLAAGFGLEADAVERSMTDAARVIAG